MKKKPSRGIMGYLVLLGTLLLIAILLNGGLSQTVSKRIEYPQLLTMIDEGNVARVAIRNNSLVGLTTTTHVADADFPERSYDFETTIGADFLDTVRLMEAQKQGKKAEDISVKDLSFDLEYRAPVTVPWWYDFLPYLIMLVLMAAFWFVIMRAQGGGNGRVMNFGKSRARLQDPGNIGTIIRTAEAAGFGALIAIKGTGDIFSPKTARAAAGSLLRVDVFEGMDTDAAVCFCRERGLRIIASDLEGAVEYTAANMTGNIALVIGNEGSGISGAFRDAADQRVKIPMEGNIESLNAAAAAAVLMYEAVRQRHAAGKAE